MIVCPCTRGGRCTSRWPKPKEQDMARPTMPTREQVPIVEVEREGRTMWQFTCAACGARSALFSTLALAEDEAFKTGKSHARFRCTGAP